MKNKVTVILDAQAGSCGKGKFAGYLALHDDIELSINNWMSNAGHTYVSNYGEAIMTQHLPTSMVNQHTTLVIGPGAAITPSILLDEIWKYRKILNGRYIIINPRAMVIQDKHCEEERQIIRSGSTFKGCGTAQAEKIIRKPGVQLFGDWFKKHFVLSDELKSKGWSDEHIWAVNQIQCCDTMGLVNDMIDYKYNTLIEGSQGCDLDINYGLDYPYTTSRQCHAGQLLADCGISPRLVDEIIMIMRPYPIRISNKTDLRASDSSPVEISSGQYDGSKELTWDIIKERCGAPADMEFGEITTVTKKPRRVFEMNWDRLKYVTKLNRPTQIAINFIQYIDWNMLGKTKKSDITPKAWEFIKLVERMTGVKVTMIGTGAENSAIIDLR